MPVFCVWVQVQLVSNYLFDDRGIMDQMKNMEKEKDEPLKVLPNQLQLLPAKDNATVVRSSRIIR